MLSSNNSRTDVQDTGALKRRLVELLEANDSEYAQILAREAVKNATDVSVEVGEDRVIVETPLFRGEHGVDIEDGAPVVTTPGEFNCADPDLDLGFQVYSVNPVVAEKIEQQLRPTTSRPVADDDMEDGEHDDHEQNGSIVARVIDAVRRMIQ